MYTIGTSVPANGRMYIVEHTGGTHSIFQADPDHIMFSCLYKMVACGSAGAGGTCGLIGSVGRLVILTAILWSTIPGSFRSPTLSSTYPFSRSWLPFRIFTGSRYGGVGVAFRVGSVSIFYSNEGTNSDDWKDWREREHYYKKAGQEPKSFQ